MMVKKYCCILIYMGEKSTYFRRRVNHLQRDEDQVVPRLLSIARDSC